MRLEIENRSRGPWGALGGLVRAVVLLAFWLPLPAGLVALRAYGEVVLANPAPVAIDETTAEVPSRIRSSEGFVVGGLERGGRPWVPYAELSSDFVRVLLASEDTRFFRHSGFDLRGLLRALARNLAAGEAVQGGSTITQQLAKSFVGRERTFERKLAELVVARRIEATWSKREILEAYANRIYFGAGAVGIGAAAEIFFGVEPSDLDLAQSALLVAMIPSPGRYTPFDHSEEAQARRDRVLSRLFETGLAGRREVDEARARPLELARVRLERVDAPELERGTWRELGQQDPERDWRYGGLEIRTGVELTRQVEAREALADGLFALDRRQGWRGPVAEIVPENEGAFRLTWERGEWTGAVRPALVTEVTRDSVRLWCGEEVRVGEEGWSWAAPFDGTSEENDRRIASPDEAFRPGQVVLLREGAIVQWPRVEGAFGSADLADGHIEAIVGGLDSFRNEFDRVTQGCRQPGSTFKPVVYSAALDSGWTLATLLHDSPLRVELGPMEEWRPRNSDGSFSGLMTLWEAFIWSRNLPAIEVYRDVGAQRTIARAHELGIDSPLDAVESLALGASCVTPIELLEAYAVLARSGRGVDPFVVAGVADMENERVLEHDVASQAWASPADRHRALWQANPIWSRPRIHADSAWLMDFLLAEVVRTGTGSDLNGLGFPTAGKTGTTTAYDAWFAGFSAREVAVTWVGTDENTRPLGRGESGGHLALPIWGESIRDVEPSTPLLSPVPSTITMVAIDPDSGRLAGEGRWAVEMPFLRGTAPREVAPSRSEMESMRVDRIEREF